MANINALEKLAYDEDNDTAAMGSSNDNGLSKKAGGGPLDFIGDGPGLFDIGSSASSGEVLPLVGAGVAGIGSAAALAWLVSKLLKKSKQDGEKKTNENALKKLAYNEDNDTAGIGTWDQNAIGTAVPDGTGRYVTVTPPVTKKTVPAKTYTGNLIGNAQKDPRGRGAALNLINWIFPKTHVGKEDFDIKNPALAKLREEQASLAAKTYFGNLEGVKQYLIERGEANQKHQNKDNTVPFAPIDIPRLRQLLKGDWGKLTPKMLQMLPAIQNSMVKARGAGRSGATA